MDENFLPGETSGDALGPERSVAPKRPRTGRREFLKGTAALGVGAAATGIVGADEDEDEADGGWEASAVNADGGMISSSHPMASEIGAAVLEDGGNAFDAAAAVQLALTLVEPNMSGLGGSSMALVYDADSGQRYAVDGMARAPIEASPQIRFEDDGSVKPPFDRSYGGITIGTPGTLRALDVMLKRWGTRSIGEVAGRIASIAEDGVEVDERLETYVGWTNWRFNDAARELFAPDGEPLSAGDTLVNEDLARTLRLIESSGIEPFYRGEIGEAIADYVRNVGGVMTGADLRSYRATIEPVPSITYDAHPTVENGGEIEVASSPPSSYGPVVLGLLKLVEGFDLEQYGPHSAERYHYLAEARRLASAPVYEWNGDQESVDVPVRGMLADEYVEERRSMIDPDRSDFDLVYEPGDPWVHQPGQQHVTDPPVGIDRGDLADESASDEDTGETTHFVTADAEGNVVSFTGTLSSSFGSGYVVPGYGFFLNNSISNMDTEPGPGQIAPLRRYNSSISPSMVFRDGEPILALGSPGGGAIPRAVSGVLTNVLEYGMSIAEAISHPRMYVWMWEPDVDSGVLEGMRAREHDVDDGPTSDIGDVQAIRIDRERGEFVGVADPRRGGAAVGVSETKVHRPPRE